MAIKAIGFDYGGVMMNRVGGIKSESISKILGVDLEEYRTVYFKHNHLRNLGTLSSDAFWTKIAHELGKPEKVGELLLFTNDPPTPFAIPEMVSLVDRLRQKYKVGLLSNNVREARAEMESIDIPRHFDVAMISAEIGYQKPDTKAFEIFFNALGVEPSEALYIDDSPRSLDSADEIGFQSILFTGYEDLVRVLEDRGVLPGS